MNTKVYLHFLLTRYLSLRISYRNKPMVPTGDTDPDSMAVLFSMLACHYYVHGP